ncbi:hypothetical protein KDL44_04595 [bacterium]|nr:hypothetical protein [bacterium]
MTGPSLLADARELIALMRGRTDNPLLEQWQLARTRRRQRSGWWQRYGSLILCWLPSLTAYLYFSSLPFGNRVELSNIAVPFILGLGPLLLLSALLLPARLRRRRITLLILGGLISFGTSFLDLHLYSSDVEQAIVATSFLVLIPLFAFTLAGLFGALSHALDISSDNGEARRDSAAQDIRLSLLSEREILLAYLALHLPSLLRRLLWLGWGVTIVLILSAEDLSIGSFVLLPALLGALVWVSSQLPVCLMLMLAALSIRLTGLQARTRLSVLLLFIGAQYGLALASCFVMFDPTHGGDVEISFVGLWGCMLQLSPLLLAIPLAVAMARNPAGPAFLLSRLLMLLSLLYTVAVLVPDLQYVSQAYVAGHLPDFVLSLLLPLILLSGLWMARHRSLARPLLLVSPALFGALSFVILIVVMFGISPASLPTPLLELGRCVAAYSVGSVLAVQSSIFWGDWNSLNEPLIEWWRWPLHVALQYVGISVLYRLALQQLRAWRMNQ